MISQEQFDMQMNRLREAWPRAFDNPQRIEMIWDIVRMMGFGDFVEMVSKMIGGMRKPPLPIDFAEYIKSKRRYVSNSAPAERAVSCIQCDDLGMVRVDLPGHPPAVALCNCAQGKKQLWRLPVVTANLRREARISKCPIEWFRRGEHIDKGEKDWGNRVKESMKFWDDHGVIE